MAQDTMRALAKLEAKPGLWALDDAPIPKIDDYDVLIKVKKSAICGTDLHIYNWDAWSQKTIPVPMIVGHEYVGEIVEIGPRVKGFKVGERVSGEGHIVCGRCRNCRAGQRHLCKFTQGIGVQIQGSFAEYVKMPADNVISVPSDISDDVASIFDPLGNAVHTALSFEMIGEDVLITGAGPIGLMAIPICRHVGARNIVITDVNPYRLKLAKQMGATRTVDVTQEKIEDVMNELNMTEGFDINLEMSGHENAIDDMLHTMNSGGRVALLGIPAKDIAINLHHVIFKGITMKGIYGREMYETWYKMIAMLQGGLDISKVITHQFDISEYEKGFEVMNSGQCGKVILNWD